MTWHCQPRFESLCFLGVVLFHDMESSYTATFNVGFIVVEPAMDGYVCCLGSLAGRDLGPDYLTSAHSWLDPETLVGTVIRRETVR